MRTKLALLVTILALGTLLTACMPCTITIQPQPIQRTITVTGTGKVTLTPDIANVNIGVQTQDASATVAMNTNNTRAQDLIDAIKSFGVIVSCFP